MSLEAWKQKHVTKVRGQTWISLAMAKGKKLNVMNSFRDCFCKYSALIYHKLYQKFLLLYGWFTGSLRMERWTCWAWFTFAAGSGSRKYSGSPCCSSNLSIFPLTSPDEAVCLQSTCLIFFFALVVNIEMLLMTWKMILHSTSHHHCDPPWEETGDVVKFHHSLESGSASLLHRWM